MGKPRAWLAKVVRWTGFRALCITGGFILATWVATFAFFYWVDGRTDTECVGLTPTLSENLGAEPGEEADEPVTIAAPTTAPTISFDVLRNAQTTTIALTSAGDLPDDIDEAQVVLESFSREGVKVELLLAYQVRRVGDAAVLDVCVDSRPLETEPTGTTDPDDDDEATVELASLTEDELPGREGFGDWLTGTADTRPGVYNARLHVRHAGVTAEVIPIEVRFQGRYLWLIIPGIVIMPFLAVFLVHKSWPKNTRQLLIPTIAGGAAAAVVWNSQGYNDPKWGGLVATFGLVAAMYSAAVAAVSTLAETDDPNDGADDPP
jgi:hypothetical protein